MNATGAHRFIDGGGCEGIEMGGGDKQQVLIMCLQRGTVLIEYSIKPGR